LEIKTILVPTDFSEYAAYAYQWALGWADRSKAKVLLFYATPSLPFLAFPESVYAMVAEARKQMAAFAAKKGMSTVAVETRVGVGEALWEICKVAEEAHVDLIVMGSHGRTGVSHVLLGSVAERVVRHAPCPVLVARLPKPKPS
jgi:universal stress protein A